MAELINSLKTFASYSTGAQNLSLGKHSTTATQSRDGSTMIFGRTDSCNESGFNQWRDAMRMVARLPGGLPPEFRLRLWENLADRYFLEHGIDWSRVRNKCRVENSRDDEIAEQIQKDLHRTGCRGFSGAKQAVLKQVLVSYARWNPGVGYCQGFNMIGAMLLQMTNGDEKLTLKILIYLIEGVLPEGYFSPGLRGLAVDMAVFRDILKLRKPSLNAHLSVLQKRDDSPPLTDVFTMHWFLTLFIHCLPTNSVLRIWDLVLLEGSEVLLRTALVLWATIETRVLCVTSTDEFYSVMGVVTRELLEFGLMDPNSLVKCIVSVGPFPFPGLEELRQKNRNLISQDTPHKSFFLAKKELDTLKRHYATIRHRQRATTVILKGLNTQIKEQRATLAVPTKRQVISPKPKIRRQISGKTSSANSKNSATVSGVRSEFRAKQVTVAWDKIAKKPKTFRKRRTSASSHTTSSSSSTELCDSSSEIENFSDTIWVSQGGKETTNETEANQDKPILGTSETPIIVVPKCSKSQEDCSDEKLLMTLNDSECSSDGSKCLDTNDSQHFLEEMSRLGKSDSFYGNLSQRICELQFQNLRILTTCNTTIDKEASPREEFAISPMPSPSTPLKPIRSFQEMSKLATLSPNQWSPRGSVSSNGGESPLPKSPMSPRSDRNFIGLVGCRESPRSSNSSEEPPIYELEKNATNLIFRSEPSSESLPDFVLDRKIQTTSPKSSPSTLYSAFLEPSCTQYNEKLDQQKDIENIVINYESEYTSVEGLKGNAPSRESARLNKDLRLDLNIPSTTQPKVSSPEIQGLIEAEVDDISELNVPSYDKHSDASRDLSKSPNSSLQNEATPGISEGQNAQTTEDINAVIRENIAILQRLKLKPAYGDEEEDFDYFEYDSSDSNEVSDAEPCTNGPHCRHVNLKSSFKTNYETKALKPRKSSKSSNAEAQPYKPKTLFNPFPTKRKSQQRTTKFGLYS